MKKLVLLLAVLILLAILAGCEKEVEVCRSSTSGNAGQQSVQGNAPAYTVFFIEKMPCVWIAGAGPTCDWSKWTGE